MPRPATLAIAAVLCVACACDLDTTRPASRRAEPDHVAAHDHSWRHRAQIERSETCGCFHCLATYEPSEIREWRDGGDTAICPRCGMDSVIGDASGFSIDEPFLRRMHEHWF